eukprot:5238833-Amphidinium_carterae.2
MAYSGATLQGIRVGERIQTKLTTHYIQEVYKLTQGIGAIMPQCGTSKYGTTERHARRYRKISL